MNLSKTQYYGGDGTGRDTYIYMANGGFCPEKQPCRMEEIGKSFIHAFPIQVFSDHVMLVLKL